MPRRKVPLAMGEIYHVYNSSIADFRIFNTESDYKRMMDEIVFYVIDKPTCRFSSFKKFKENFKLNDLQSNFFKKITEIIAYCIMPTHIHFILREIKKNGIATFMNSILKSYSLYFNLKHKRKGPLWEGRFKNVLIENDDQFIHVTRYIHLNPVTAYLVDKPEDWRYSSYNEYMGSVKTSKRLCNFSDYLDMDIASYDKFVKDQIGYQRELEAIKHLTLE